MGWDWGRIGTGIVTGGLSEAWNPNNYGLGSGGSATDWLGQHADQPTSNIPDANRGNFDLPGYAGRNAWDTQQMLGAQGRAAPQAADSSFRSTQQDLINRLGRQMSGQDSLSALQLRDATDANIAQQRSQVASASPGNAAMAQRLAMQNTGRMNQGYGAQAAQLGIQERNAAANALAGVAGQARGQDLQNNEFNTSAQLQRAGQNDQYALGIGGLNLQNAGMQQQGSMGYEQNQTQRRGQDLGIQMGPANWERVVNGAGAVAPLVAASDERLKTGISTPSGDELDMLIDRLHPQRYSYRDPALGSGPRVGVMAQDVERGGPAGQALVADVGGPGGPKVLDVPKSLGTALGLIGRLGERVAQMEDGGRIAARTKTSTDAPRPKPPAAPVAAKRRGMLPGEISKDASAMAEKGK